MANQVDFPDIYIDASVGSGGVGSEADPYSSFSEINWNSGGDNDISAYYAGTPSASVTINLKRGETFREYWQLYGGGSADYRLKIQAYGTGELPIVSGASLVTGWTQCSADGDIYKSSLSTEPNQIWMDYTFGDRRDLLNVLGDGAQTLDNQYDWYWDEDGSVLDEEADTLYIWTGSGNDPDTYYDSPGVEAEQRQYCINTNLQNYIDIDGINISKARQWGLYLAESSHITIKNCVLEWSWGDGVTEWQMFSTPTDIIIEDNISRYNGGTGIGNSVITGGGLSNFIIRRNTCYENGRHQEPHDYPCWDSGSHDFTSAIKVWSNDIVCSGIKIYENICYDNGPETEIFGDAQKGNGIWVDQMFGADGDPVRVYNNLCRDNAGAGIFIEIARWAEVYGNVIYRCGTGSTSSSDYAAAGIRVDSRMGFIANNNKVCNNTIVDCYIGLHASSYGQTGSSRFDDNTFKNNIVSGCTIALRCGNAASNDGTWGSGNLYGNNCLGAEPVSLGWGASLYTTYDTWLAAANSSEDIQPDNNIEDDASFTNTGSDDYSLASDDPGIGEGENLGQPFNTGILPNSAWPDGVVTGDRGNY